MPDKKLTDADHIKALEILLEKLSNEKFMIIAEEGIKNLSFCLTNVLDLLNRQQTNYESLNAQEEKAHQYCKNVCEPKYKAEIEKLNQINFDLCVAGGKLLHKTETIKAEAYKEFAERFKALLETELVWCECVDEITKPLDNLLKELTNEQPPNDVKCIDCEYLETNKAWGVCTEAHKMVHPNDCCGKGKLKGDGNA